MRTSLGNIDVQPARTAPTPGWRDPRLWVGLALVAVSVVVGAKVVGGEDRTVAMWALGADHAPGDRIEADDLVATKVHFADPSDARRYFRADEALPGDLHLRRALGEGELLPRTVLGPEPDDVVRISVAVSTSAVPPGLGAGDVVDLWAAPRAAGGDAEREAERLARDVVVVAVPRAASDLGGAAVDQQVVLAVPDRRRELAKVLAAGSAGELLVVGRR